MGFALSEVTYSPPLSGPLTYNYWMQVTQSLGGCTAARHIQWLYSLVSVQGDRSICVYQVPYTDALRQAYREAGVIFQKMWQIELWMYQDPANLPQGFSLIIAEVNHDPPLTKPMYESGKEAAKGCFDELNVQHIFSAMTLDGTHSICVFSAASAETVRSLYRKIRQPFEQVWKASLIRPA